MEKGIPAPTKRLSLTLKRSYPVEPWKVWRAWVDPQALAQWFRPEGFTVPLAEADVRVGRRVSRGGPLSVTLRAAGKGTELELEHAGYLDRGEEVKTHEEGWTGALAQLGEVLVL